MNWRESSAILDAAYDAGVRHFDVAAMYGFGDAERCLGDFARRHRNGSGITLTTKFGLVGGKKRRLFRLARSIARPVFRQFKRPVATPPIVAPGTPIAAERPLPDPSRFAVEKAAASLNASLAALRVDHIHLLLMHEVQAAELVDERLLRFLENAVQSGKIGTFGVGSDRSKVPDLLALKREYCPVTQYQWCAADPVTESTQWFRIHHGAFCNRLRFVQLKLQSDPAMSAAWSGIVGCDLADATQFSRLVLRASIVLNPDSIILFATRRKEHVHANCVAANCISMDDAVHRFAMLLRDQTVYENGQTQSA